SSYGCCPFIWCSGGWVPADPIFCSGITAPGTTGDYTGQLVFKCYCETTPPPCAGNCYWTWNGSIWVRDSGTSSCPEGTAESGFCYCLTPASPGSTIGQTTTTACTKPPPCPG